MQILGISAYYHDSAAALVRDGAIVAAAQEERFSRRKHDPGFPASAVRYCLTQAGAPLAALDSVVFYEKPFLKFERLIDTYLAFAPRGFSSFRRSIPLWAHEKLFQKKLLLQELLAIDERFDRTKLLFCPHHVSHAASAFYPSPFEDAAILTMDGVGEWATTSTAIGRGNRIDLRAEIAFPHSLGLLYSAFTYYTGFKVNSGEYKLMGLAPYGKPRYAGLILNHLIDLKPDGSFRLDMAYFNYCTGLTMTSHRFSDLFGRPARSPSEPIDSFHMDVAASIQAVLDESVLRMSRDLAATTGRKNLCLAGGVALNCVTNGKLLRDGCFEHLWIQPAAGDAGGAAGAALAAYYTSHERLGRAGAMESAYLGPEFGDGDIEAALRSAGATYDVLPERDLLNATVSALVEGKAVGWFQGRMEFGPRALGARSILADPRSPTMQATLNQKIKFRESFRPFAPAIPRERLETWFDLNVDSPFMLLVAAALRPDIPAVTHVDNSARIQTVDARTNPLFHALLLAFEAATGCPVLINTSFNVRGEPIVCTPADAFRCFMGSGLDALAIGSCFLEKPRQDPSLLHDYAASLEPD